VPFPFLQTWTLEYPVFQLALERLGIRCVVVHAHNATAEYGPSPHRIRLAPAKFANTPRFGYC
jgi:hypothetical protein